MKGGELLEMTAKFKDLWDRFQRVQSSEQSLRTKLNDLNKASHALEAIKCSLKPASSVTGIDMSFFFHYNDSNMLTGHNIIKF